MHSIVHELHSRELGRGMHGKQTARTRHDTALMFYLNPNLA
ncbi:hypothetical protein ID866_12952 [Astraeus odoratus]|nr:hypothetical protein ID866_12952 [Astraeus odoratus]